MGRAAAGARGQAGVRDGWCQRHYHQGSSQGVCGQGHHLEIRHPGEDPLHRHHSQDQRWQDQQDGAAQAVREHVGVRMLPQLRMIEEETVSNLTLAGLNEMVGRELGISGWGASGQARIDAFASCTGDHQWIHVDVERAKRESPFRGPIAHGYLTLAMVAPLAMQIGIIPKDAAAGLNYGIDKVRFLAPVPAGARVRLRVTLAGVEPKDGGQVIMKTQNTLEVEGSEKPALIAETLALLIPASGARKQ